MTETTNNSYELPADKKWKFIGTCSCRGQDLSCAEKDELWIIVDREEK